VEKLLSRAVISRDRQRGGLLTVISQKELLSMDAGKKEINKNILIGIAGGFGSGKTLIAETLLKDMGSESNKKVTFSKRVTFY